VAAANVVTSTTINMAVLVNMMAQSSNMSHGLA
jgi:hypothetical protein